MKNDSRDLLLSCLVITVSLCCIVYDPLKPWVCGSRLKSLPIRREESEQVARERHLLLQRYQSYFTSAKNSKVGPGGSNHSFPCGPDRDSLTRRFAIIQAHVMHTWVPNGSSFVAETETCGGNLAGCILVEQQAILDNCRTLYLSMGGPNVSVYFTPPRSTWTGIPKGQVDGLG
jgi:hypothetical protein